MKFMTGKGLAVIVLFLLSPMWVAFAGGSSESAATSSHGKYLAGRRIIIPPSDIHIDSQFASVDYRYPKPEPGELGLYLFSGNRQLSVNGQEELVQIGIQAGEVEFENLEPMNLAFVIDKSGSMDGADKMAWVQDAFDVFIERVRDTDFVALVTFDNEARVVFPSTGMNRENRLRFKDRVHGILPGGGTNLVAGLELGYGQVMANYRSEYTNRVLFLTDGVGESQGILSMAEQFADLGINVSTIGVGSDFDVNLMVELAKAGGGSSRFISDREEMEEIFGSELDRMVVPALNDLALRIQLPRGYEVVETWGYNHQNLGNEARYSLPTLHHRDYETILLRIRIPDGIESGRAEIARVTASYRTAESQVHAGPIILDADFVEVTSPVSGYTNSMVLKSGTMLQFAESIIAIGELYYSCQEEINRINTLRDGIWRESSSSSDSGEDSGEGSEISYDSISTPEISALEESVRSKFNRAMEITVENKAWLENARLRLDNDGFDDEIEILNRYIEILGSEMEEEVDRIAERVASAEITPRVADRSLNDHVANLFREIRLSLGTNVSGTIAVTGFTGRTEAGNALIELLNEMALVETARLDGLIVVERSRLTEIIDEQKLQLSGLVDTETAIEIGRLLSAQYILTGSVIEMPQSVVVFGRIIDVESSEIESVAQVILPKSVEIEAMLLDG